GRRLEADPNRRGLRSTFQESVEERFRKPAFRVPREDRRADTGARWAEKSAARRGCRNRRERRSDRAEASGKGSGFGRGGFCRRDFLRPRNRKMGIKGARES